MKRLVFFASLYIALIYLTGCASAPHSTVATPAKPTTRQASGGELAGKIRPILHRLDGKSALVSARVIELSTGRELFSDNADQPMTPASNQKLAVSAAALDRLGPDYTYKTTLAIDGDDLWLIGTGDPATGDPTIARAAGEKPTTMLDRWAEELKKLDVRRLKGKLYFYDGTFDGQRTHPTWHRSYITDWYAAPIAGLNFNDNCIDITVRPGTAEKLAEFEVMPPNRAVIIQNQTTSGTGQPAEISRKDEADDFTLTGKVSAKKELESKAIIDPGFFFAEALRENLKQHGIVVDGQSIRAKSPLDLTAKVDNRRVVSVHSTTLKTIIRRLNKNSQNLFAEALAKTLARTLPGGGDQPGSWPAGGQVVYDFLRKSGVDTAGYQFVDGSGLSEGNRLTARGQTQLLLAMDKHRDRDVFLDSLPICGKDGTIAKRMKDIAGRVQAKTGSLNSVRALSGFVTTRQGRRLVFSVLLNRVAGSTKAAEEIEDDICRALVEWPGE